MTQSELAAALQRRQHTRKNLKRYMHTRSFNQLAGRNTAPGSDRRTRRSHASAKIMLSLSPWEASPPGCTSFSSDFSGRIGLIPRRSGRKRWAAAAF